MAPNTSRRRSGVHRRPIRPPWCLPFYVAVLVKPRAVGMHHPRPDPRVRFRKTLAASLMSASPRLQDSTTFYPCRPRRGPDTRVSVRRPGGRGSAGRDAPSFYWLACSEPGGKSSAPHQRFCPVSVLTDRVSQVLTMAPAGGSPVSRYRHRATRSFRATATRPRFRARLPASAKRRSYHRVIRLSG